MTIIVVLLIFSLLVLVHEFGHFIVAKKNNVLVEEFGIGFPPRIFGKKIGETLYSINLIPLGGFVKVYGEEYHEEKKIDPLLKNRAFVDKKNWQKALIVLAGIINNFLLGWILMTFLLTQGLPVPPDHVLAQGVQSGSPAAVAGIKPNDTIQKLSINGKTVSITSNDQLRLLGQQYAGHDIALTIMRNNTPLIIHITPRIVHNATQGALGIELVTFVEKKYVWYEAPYQGLVQAFTISKTILTELLKTVGLLITFHAPSVEVAGPVGITQFTGEALKFGHNAVFELIALLSLNLAVVNLLPFPALDGGKLSFIVYEWVTKRRVNPKVEQYTNLFGIITLLALSALITVHDIMKLVHK